MRLRPEWRNGTTQESRPIPIDAWADGLKLLEKLKVELIPFVAVKSLLLLFVIIIGAVVVELERPSRSLKSNFTRISEE